MARVGVGMTRDLPGCGWDPSCNPAVGPDVAPDETPNRPPRSFEMSTTTQPPADGPESPTLTRPTNEPGSGVTGPQEPAQREPGAGEDVGDAAPASPSAARRLSDALPEHAHVTRPLFGIGETRWTWTTPAGVWKVTQTVWVGSPLGWTVTGPGGRWVVPADRVLPLLRALGAIPDGPTGGAA